MKKASLKNHLKEYSIYSKRKTTINHAFASALSYFDDYDEKVTDRALKILGQSNKTIIKCIYCDKNAETWDHLFPLVKNGEFTGHGHHIGNLVPACKKCNSSKGRKNWFDFISPIDIERRTLIENYINEFKYNVIDMNDVILNKELNEYKNIKEQIFDLMKMADRKAQDIRSIILENMSKNSR